MVVIHGEIVKAEATLYMERIMRHLMTQPTDEQMYLFLQNIIQEANGLLVFRNGCVYPDPDLAGLDFFPIQFY